MADTTPICDIPRPQIDDVAVIETAVRPALNVIDTISFPRFSTLASRNSKITSPIEGQVCYVTATKESYHYDGSTWIGLRPRVKRKLASEDRTNDTYNIDDHFTVTVETFSAYIWRMQCIMTVNDPAPDMKIKWLGPTGGLLVYGGVGLTPATTSVVDSNMNAAGGNGLGTELQYGIVNGFTNHVIQTGTLITGASDGTFDMYWAHSTNTPGATLSMGGGFLEILKVA